MYATRRGRAIPLAGTAVLACVVLAIGSGLNLVPAGHVAVGTEADAEHACPTRDEPVLGRTWALCDPMGFVSPEAREGCLRERVRPTLPHYIETEHFRIWYDTTGPDSVHGWPDTTFLHECRVVAERSWRGIVDTLGFRPPPLDGSDPDGGGGSDHYDIYIADNDEVGYFRGGATVPGDPEYDMTSYVVIDNDFAEWNWVSSLDMVRCVIAHEFTHAAQLAHNFHLAFWLSEGTAVWSSEMMYDYIDEYLFDKWGDGPSIGYVLARPYDSLERNDIPHCYARVLWAFYLSESYGTAVIPEIWYDIEEHSATGHEILSITHVLADHGVDFESAFEEYCIWNWFTGDRDDGNHYEEGGGPDWQESTPQATYSSFPVVGGSPPDTCRPDHLACNYIHFERGSSDDEVLHITYNGPAVISLPNAAHVTYLDNDLNSFYYAEISLNPWGDGDIYIEDFDEMSLVCLVVINKSDTHENMNYTFHAELFPTGVPEAAGLALSAPVPNPCALGTDIAYSVPSDATRANLSVYDVSGRLVATLIDGVTVPGDAVTHWDGTDTDGRRAASGVYFVRIVAGDETAVRRLVLLR